MFDFLGGILNFLLVENWPLTLVAVLGLVAIYVLLPRPRRGPVALGVLCAVAAMGFGGLYLTRVAGLTVETFLFYVFSGTAVLSGCMLITQTNPARAALSFALVILAVCGLFLLNAAPFLMAATITVYAGAIIVTFLFVLMLAQQEGPSDADARSREPFLSSVTGFLLLLALLYVLKITYKPDLDQWVMRSKEFLDRVERAENERAGPGVTQAIARELYKFLEEYEQWWKSGKDDVSRKFPAGGKRLSDALIDAREGLPVERREGGVTDVLPPDPAALKRDVTRLYLVGLEVRNSPLLGSRQPVGKGADYLSELSGPRSSRPPEQLRGVREEGKPKLPAENTAYLGRSLFSDYLLAVEVAGTLLLIAAIGAIAIANRRQSGPERKA